MQGVNMQPIELQSVQACASPVAGGPALVDVTIVKKDGTLRIMGALT